MNTEERRALWLLAEVVEFEGGWYKEVPAPAGRSGDCTGCAFLTSGPAFGDFHEAFRTIRDAQYCYDSIWKRTGSTIS